MPIKQDSGLHRKSLRNSQNIRFKFKIQTLAFWIFIIILFLAFIWIFNRDNFQPQSQGIFKQESKLQTQNSFVFYNFSQKSQKYLTNYCGNATCKQNQIVILHSLIELLDMDSMIYQKQLSLGFITQKTNFQKKELVQISKDNQSQQNQPSLYQKLIQYSIQAVKNSELTTPKTYKPNLAQFITAFFFQEDPYPRIESLFQNSNQIWQIQCDNGLITVQAALKIQPHIIQIVSELIFATKMQIIGLLLTPTNQLTGVALGHYELKPGLNVLQCDNAACNEDYSMVLFRINKIKLSSLKVFKKIII